MSASSGENKGVQRRNLRTALVMLTIAAAFFAGIIVKYWLFG